MKFTRKRPSFGEQKWENILFVHWPVEKNRLRPYIPQAFQINEWGGKAWLTAVIFTAKETKLISTPKLFSYPSFSQFNLRSYVNFGKERGVYFLSIHTDDPLIAKLARLGGLPFSHSQIEEGAKGEGGKIQVFDQPGQEFLSLTYRQVGPNFQAKPKSLAHFLTEKYCIWIIRGKRILKLPVSHLPWSLREAKIKVKNQAFLPDFHSGTEGVIAHYSEFMQAYLHPYESYGIYK